MHLLEDIINRCSCHPYESNWCFNRDLIGLWPYGRAFFFLHPSIMGNKRISNDSMSQKAFKRKVSSASLLIIHTLWEYSHHILQSNIFLSVNLAFPQIFEVKLEIHYPPLQEYTKNTSFVSSVMSLLAHSS